MKNQPADHSGQNQAERQPELNLQIAKAYIADTDSRITTGTCSSCFRMKTRWRNQQPSQIRFGRRHSLLGRGQFDFAIAIVVLIS